MVMEIIGDTPKRREVKLFVSIWGASKQGLRTKGGKKSVTFTVKGATGIDELSEFLKNAIRSARV